MSAASIQLFNQGARELRRAPLSVQDYKDLDGGPVAASLEDANVVTSMVPGWDLHRPVIDVDIPMQYVPSSTPGHGHLYVDKMIPWQVYLDLLEALASAGIVERGYVNASVERGYTAVRLPWIRKSKEAGQ